MSDNIVLTDISTTCNKSSQRSLRDSLSPVTYLLLDKSAVFVLVVFYEYLRSLSEVGQETRGTELVA